MWRGVDFDEMLGAFGSAPAFNNTIAMSLEPMLAAICKAVVPSSSALHGSAFESSKVRRAIKASAGFMRTASIKAE
jgi:hypothetical protein